jgi:CRP/FNR family transcriptional regulator, cyclic AMP receptor protein
MTGVTGTDRYYELLAHGRTPRTYQASELIFEKGDPGESLLVVREGSVHLRDGERVVETVTAPGLFGEMALIEDTPRALSAVAATDVTVIEIPARHFWVLVHDTPYMAQLVMHVMAERLRRQSGSTGAAHVLRDASPAAEASG